MSQSVFFTRVLTLGIIPSTPFNVELVAIPLILGTLSSISVILALKTVFG